MVRFALAAATGVTQPAVGGSLNLGIAVHAPVYRSDRLRSWARIALVVLIAFNFSLNLQQIGKTYVHVDAYTHYEEKRPYQYRTLMAPVMSGLMHFFASEPVQPLLHRLPVYVSTPEGATYVAINAAGFAASCFLMLAIGRRVLPRYPLMIGTVYLAMAYLFFCLNPNVAFILPYDIPSLALTQACILCILDRRWRCLVVLFILATVNRETSFLVVAFLAVRSILHGQREGSYGLILLLGSLWVAIKLALLMMFANLPTDEGLRLAYNFEALGKPWQWPALLPLFASVAGSVQAFRAAKNDREWPLVGVLGFVLIFVVGQVTETRAFADLTVFFSVAVAILISARLDSSAAESNTAHPTRKPE